MRRVPLAFLAAMLMPAAAHASGPFGIGTPEQGGAGFGGPLSPFFVWIAVHQSHFYQALTQALTSLKQDPFGVWLLLALSFAYGVFHAVGPGHGKAVITSYLVASGDTMRRGVAISFAAAMVQAASAILFVAVGAILLRLTATAITFATDWVEIISYAAIALVGAWLLWTKSFGGGHHHHHHHHVEPSAGEDHADHHHAAHDGHPHDGHHHHDAHDHDRDHDDHHDHDHDHHDHDHHHAPAAAASPLRKAWGAILAVGIRPCSGAIIVLVFALSQGLIAAGIAATIVMGLGTGLTVAALAVFAVSARGAALRFAGGVDSPFAYRLVRVMEIGGAACVLLFGLVLLGGALANGLPAT
jgi:ABC-type nickel/cobalt efflux system permease component RcnA